MNYEITVIEPKRYILLRVYANITKELAHRFTKDIAEVADANDLYRFICDVRNVRNVLSTFDNYQYAYKDIYDLGIRHNIRSAILVSEGDKSHNFMETVVQNAGYITKIFTDEEKAFAWLSKNQEPMQENSSTKQESPAITKPKFSQGQKKSV